MAGCEADAASFTEDVQTLQLDSGAGSPAFQSNLGFINSTESGMLWGPVQLPSTGRFQAEAHFASTDKQQCAALSAAA